MDDNAKLIATLANDFLSVVHHRQANGAAAAAALMAAASAILMRDMSEVQAVEVMHSVLDEASAQFVATRCAGSC